MLKKLVVFVVLCGLSVCAFAQSPGTLKGQVADETGAVIPGAKVTAAGPSGVVKSATTGSDGTYSLPGLAPGDWTVQASSPGLTQQQVAKVNVSAGTQTLNLTLRVALEKQEVTVQEAGNNTVTLDPSNNAGALVLKGEDLEALSDDPDDLAQDLQALAGPAAGPNGGQIYIDGFTGGRLPPKEAIREIRINSNPFSSEYDRLGFGRIEIFTKPGTDKFRGMAMFNISDGQFNSRNPFLNASPGQAFAMPDFQTRQFEGNLSGPLSKKASFFIDAEHRTINDAAVIYTPYFVDPTSFAAEPFSTAAPTPQSRTSFSPRVDYALTPNNTLMARYTYTHNEQTDRGVGGFNLPSRGYGVLTTQQTGQLTETAIINSKWINETRLQIMNDNVTDNVPDKDHLLPVIDVASAFTEGGSGVGQSYNSQRRYEIQNYTSTTKGTHSIKFGVRVRATDYSDFSQSNFGGTFQFNAPPASLGFTGINSVQAYQITLQGIQRGLSIAQIRAMGGGPAQFTINTGNPALGVSQVDFGAFYQDDWRLKPNFTLSLGLRYETQNNIHDHTDLAPRIGFAWAPGSKTSGSVFSRPKLVVRGGVGVFYDRVSDNLTLQQLRYQGGYQQSITVEYPDFFPNIPAISALPAANQTHIKYQIDPNLHAPYVVQSAIGVERQLPKNTSLAVTYTNTRGIHELRLRDINAPLPGTYILGQPQTGARPYGAIGDVFNYESTGILNQNQLITNVNSRINSKISLTGGYFLSRAMSNFNGGLSPFDYNLSKEYGRAPYDVRHRGMIMGSIATKWDIRLNPFVILNSGAPFNIVTSTVAGNASRTLRPAFAPSGAAGPNIVATRFGTFDANPYNPDGSVKNGETIIPWDYGTSPGSVTVNMRLSKTWGFGPERGSNVAAASRGGGGDHGPGGGGDHGGGGGRGGPGGGGPGGMGGMRMGGGGGGGGSTNRRYNLTLSVNARNLLNHTNYGPINSALGSPTFGTSTTLAGGFGAEQSPLNNRRLEFSLRFSF